MRVLILGAGGHGLVVADIFLSAHRAGGAAVPIGYLDDAPELQRQSRLGLPILGSLEQLGTIPHDAVIVAVGDNRTRQKLYEQLHQHGERFATAVHPQSVVASDVQMGPGTMVCAGAIVNPGSVVGENVILNTGCSVDHHNRIGDHVHIAPGVHLGGDVSIGNGTLVGIGATVMPQRRVGGWTVVGAGSLVHSDLPDKVVAAGFPARVVRNLAMEE